MSSIADELKRKISDRKRAIESLGHDKKPFEKNKMINNPDRELLQVAADNSSAASGVVMQDGYSLIQSGRKGFIGKTVIFFKRAIRKVIHVCLGFYIKPILNKQTIFNGKTLNAVTSIQDWCFSKQSEIEQLQDRLMKMEQAYHKEQEENRKLLSKAEEQANILWQEKCNVEMSNACLKDTLEEKTVEIEILQYKLGMIEQENNGLNSLVQQVKENLTAYATDAKKQKDSIDKLQKEIPNIETKLLDKFDINEKALHKLNCKVGQTVKETAELSQKLREQNEEINQLGMHIHDVQQETVKALGDMETEVSETNSKVREQSKEFCVKFEQMESQLSRYVSENTTSVTKVNERIADIENVGLKELKDNAGILTHLRNKFGLHYDLNLLNNSEIDYFDFENHFRGTTEAIKKSQQPYLAYFKEGDNKESIIDLGCGRGEFLELLTESGFNAIGVDVYEPFVEHCKEKGLQIIQSDALTYLSQIPDESLGGIFMGQVVEHLSADYLVSLLRCVYRKLKKGSYFIAETPNPETLSTYCNFYLDLEHMKPVHYLTMEYFLKDAGFSEVSRYNNEFSRYPFDLQASEQMSEKAALERWQLNNILFGYRDYTIIAKK